MDTPQDAAAHAAPLKRPRSRKSIAHMPSPDTVFEAGNKENMTADIRAKGEINVNAVVGIKPGKKSRSKSIGPGGLNELREGTGNRRESASVPAVKSILKPTIPLSPLRPIPSRNSKQQNPSTQTNEITPQLPKKLHEMEHPQEILIDFSAPDSHPSNSMIEISGSTSLPNPFVSEVTQPAQAQEARVALKTEEEQQAAVREREEQEKRDLDKQNMIERRDARRKSLANRRVSFAPEATLHTWQDVEYLQDSTTSSASTNSTRRASSMLGAASPYFHPQSPAPSSDPSEAPSTPPEQIEETPVGSSPAHQRDLHQKKRWRRSSAIPPMNFNNPDDDEGSSSPFSGSSAAGSDDTSNQSPIVVDGDNTSNSGNESDGDGGSTVMSLDAEDTTIRSLASARSSSSAGSSGRLEEALRQAAQQAGTQGIEFDENGDLTMEMADGEVTAAFQPWTKNASSAGLSLEDPSKNPFSPAFKMGTTNNSSTKNKPSADDDELSMDMTRAVGAILPPKVITQAPTTDDGPKSKITGRRRSGVSRRRSSGEGSAMGDQTMELTTSFGGIQAQPEGLEEPSVIDEDEELTMEFTTVIGGVLDSQQEKPATSRATPIANDPQLLGQQVSHENQRRDSVRSTAEDGEMDMTLAVGGILPSNANHDTPEDDETIGMDITRVIGGILPRQLSAGNRSQAKALMERETDEGQLASSPFQEQFSSEATPRLAVSSHIATVASDTGSPGLANTRARTSARKSAGSRLSTTPKSAVLQSTPVKKPRTPSKQMTPQPPRPTTPGKTPPSKNVMFRTASPKKLFKAEIKSAAAAFTPKSVTSSKIFQQDVESGVSIPSIILTPRVRRSSGLGIDKEGLGSPRVAALLDRRGSIGEHAKTFSPHGQATRGIRFEDPHVMENELEEERREDERRESGRVTMEQEADLHDGEGEKDATINLKEMIESLTPKKKVVGRKSLHVGAARGLLGKRPIELDDEEGEDGSPKRLKGREGSPVKKIRLAAPPSKTETTGRITRATRRSLGDISGNLQSSTPTMAASPLKGGLASTPKNQGRFKDAEVESTSAKPPVSFAEKIAGEGEEIATIEDGEEEVEEEKLHLQDFLNMTSIRFMELNTTKRRHTVAPNAMLEGSAIELGFSDTENGNSKMPLSSGRDLESCIVAGACTIPMLELYQHSCRELKKYISEGRSIVREIETDTFEENPPLFREYISASPDVKCIMDNQFKNVKTHARLLSKAMWYEWRMKLLEGLKEGLIRVAEGMETDDSILKQQEDMLITIMPQLVSTHERVLEECQQLQAQADELANCDQEELTETREKLVTVEEDIEVKKQLVEEMQKQLNMKEEGVEAVTERRKECLEEIKEAEKVREACRGWSASEVGTLKANVEALEKQCGWTIVSASGTNLTMTYRRQLQLYFDVATFLPNTSASMPANPENSPISLTYIADSHEFHPQPLTTEKRFFLQIMRAQLQCMRQANTKVKDLVTFVSASWSKACVVAENVRVLNLSHITTPVILSDETLAVKSIMLLPGLQTKVEISVELSASSTTSTTDTIVSIAPKAKVVYGEHFNESKMKDFLTNRIGKEVTGKVEEREVAWSKVVSELGAKLMARGKR
ncbi:MAG: hypothetical protein M1827_002058 [Pycnora praestabilis]|nr:MAG: hypothetical protein M1827_002058 [Pycnora praestabilis]